MEEFDSNYLAWILYKLFYGIDKEVAKNKERSYVEIDLSNNCKYDVFYNYVKILNLMTLRSSVLFLCRGSNQGLVYAPLRSALNRGLPDL